MDDGRDRRAIKLAVFVAFGFYNRWWRYVSTRDMWRAALGVVVASVIAAYAIYFIDPFERRLPRGVALMDGVLLLGLVAGSRLLAGASERPSASRLVARGKEVIVVGAGDAGQLVIKEMQRSRQLGSHASGSSTTTRERRTFAFMASVCSGRRTSCRTCCETTGRTSS